jgi:hypothetical protein
MLRLREDDELSDADARVLLRVNFDPQDLARLRDLVTRNQDDALTPDERAELEGYLRLRRCARDTTPAAAALRARTHRGLTGAERL